MIEVSVGAKGIPIKIPDPFFCRVLAELLEVSLDRETRGSAQGGCKIRIQPVDNRLHVADALLETRDDLSLALTAVLDVRADEVERPIDDVAMSRKDAFRRERRQPIERRHVLGEPAAAAKRNHHGRAAHDHVAGVKIAAIGVPEADVIGRMAGGVHYLEPPVARPDGLTVGERPPSGFTAQRQLARLDRRPHGAKRGRA